MAKQPQSIPLSDFRRDATKALSRVRSSKNPMVITQQGRAAAVMLSIEAFERAEQERGMLHALAQGEREIARGKGYDLDDVLHEADRFLSEAG